MTCLVWPSIKGAAINVFNTVILSNDRTVLHNDITTAVRTNKITVTVIIYFVLILIMLQLFHFVSFCYITVYQHSNVLTY